MNLSHLTPNKITIRYLGLTSLGLLLAQLLFGFIQIRWRYYQRVENLTTKMQDLSQEIRIISQDSQLKLDDGTLERLMKQSSMRRDLLYSIIVNEQREPVVSYLNQQNPTIATALSQLEHIP